jgi:hypothetical protein
LTGFSDENDKYWIFDILNSKFLIEGKSTIKSIQK